MENTVTQIPGQPMAGLISMSICFLHLIAALTLNNIEVLFRIGASGVAMLAGIMAVRYHYIATQEKKESIKKLKSDK